MDDIMLSICREKKDTARVGFSSTEFEDAINVISENGFESAVNSMAIESIVKKIEGKCIGDGYVIPGSVELIERSSITFPHEALQLHYSMRVNYKFTLCNPNPGAILVCKVVTKNKIGILGRLVDPKSPLVILVPDDLCDTPNKTAVLNNAEKDSLITVMVVGKKYEQNDKKITVIAEVVIENATTFAQI